MSAGYRAIASALVTCVIAGAMSVAHGAGRDDFPTCYGMLGSSNEVKKAERELFVVIDQTVVLNLDLKRHVHRKVHEYLRPGDRITVLTFSAYAEGRYAQMPLTGKLDHALTEDERFNTGKSALRKFDQCMQRQKVHVRGKVDQVLKTAFEEASSDLPKTELIGSLVEFGQGVVSASQSRKKTVLLVSDMMENSAIVSFYGNGGINNLDVEKTLSTTKAADLFSEMDGATVNVIGAGISGNEGYLSQTAMQAMHNFWTSYFEQSDASLVGWGQPELFGPVE